MMSPTVDAAERAIIENGEYQRLAAADAQLVIGRSCYMGGQPPPGRKELHTLIVGGRTDLLLRLLEAPTPEARVYGALGLRRTGALDQARFDAWIAQAREPVTTCSGCVFWSATAREAVAAKDEFVVTSSLAGRERSP